MSGGGADAPEELDQRGDQERGGFRYFDPAVLDVRVPSDVWRDAVGLARLRVRDHGDGIPPDELEAVFDKFIQSSKTKSGAGGTGLGLSICREIVDWHQGRIWAQNHPEAGAVFTVELPLSRCESRQPVETGAARGA